MWSEFNNEADAVAAAAAVTGATIRREDGKLTKKPEAFWQELETATNPVAVRIRAEAEKNHNGCIRAAWDDASEGGVRGLAASLIQAIDRQWRIEENYSRWIVSTPHVAVVEKEIENWPSEGWTTED